MTTIAAVEQAGTVLVGWDSQATAGNETFDLSTKVFTNGSLVFGASGPVRAGQVLQYADLPLLDTWDVDRWVTRSLTPEIRKQFVEAELVSKTDGMWQGRAFIVAGGRVYMLHSDFSWTRRASGRMAIGSGGDYALGALAAAADLPTALRVAAEHDPYTAAPFHIARVVVTNGRAELVNGPLP